MQICTKSTKPCTVYGQDYASIHTLLRPFALYRHLCCPYSSWKALGKWKKQIFVWTTALDHFTFPWKCRSSSRHPASAGHLKRKCCLELPRSRRMRSTWQAIAAGTARTSSSWSYPPWLFFLEDSFQFIQHSIFVLFRPLWVPQPTMFHYFLWSFSSKCARTCTSFHKDLEHALTPKISIHMHNKAYTLHSAKNHIKCHYFASAVRTTHLKKETCICTWFRALLINNPLNSYDVPWAFQCFRQCSLCSQCSKWYWNKVLTDLEPWRIKFSHLSAEACANKGMGGSQTPSIVKMNMVEWGWPTMIETSVFVLS